MLHLFSFPFKLKETCNCRQQSAISTLHQSTSLLKQSWSLGAAVWLHIALKYFLQAEYKGHISSIGMNEQYLGYSQWLEQYTISTVSAHHITSCFCSLLIVSSSSFDKTSVSVSPDSESSPGFRSVMLDWGKTAVMHLLGLTNACLHRWAAMWGWEHPVWSDLTAQMH